MLGPSIQCSRCENPFPAAVFNTDGFTVCPSCTSWIRLIAFPAALKPADQGKTGDLILVDGEAGCFYHPEKKAVLPCDACGRFLCALCDVEMGADHLCPLCIETGKKKGKLKNLENHRVRYDDLALALAIIPILFSCIVALTAPIAMYVAIRYWNAPGSILPRTKVRFVVAIVFAVVEIVGCAVLGYFWIKGMR
jgi:hypothetical protein